MGKKKKKKLLIHAASLVTQNNFKLIIVFKRSIDSEIMLKAVTSKFKAMKMYINIAYY